jgi:hypothetical protein
MSAVLQGILLIVIFFAANFLFNLAEAILAGGIPAFTLGSTYIHASPLAELDLLSRYLPQIGFAVLGALVISVALVLYARLRDYVEERIGHLGERLEARDPDYLAVLEEVGSDATDAFVKNPTEYGSALIRYSKERAFVYQSRPYRLALVQEFLAQDPDFLDYMEYRLPQARRRRRRVTYLSVLALAASVIGLRVLTLIQLHG